MARRVDPRLKKCRETGLDVESCRTLIRAVDRLDEENRRIWHVSDTFVPDSQNYNRLNRAYEMIRDARDYIRDIIGDVD